MQEFTVVGYYESNNGQTFCSTYTADDWRGAWRKASLLGVSVCAVFKGNIMPVDDLDYSNDAPAGS